jgi:hypothetical protein
MEVMKEPCPGSSIPENVQKYLGIEKKGGIRSDGAERQINHKRAIDTILQKLTDDSSWLFVYDVGDQRKAEIAA